MKKNLPSIILFLFSIFLALPTFAQGNGGGNGGNGGGGNGGNNGGNTYQILGKQQPCVGSIETYTIDPNPGNNAIDWGWDPPRASSGTTDWVLLSTSADKSQATFRVGDKPGTIRAKPIPSSNNTETLPVHPAEPLQISIDGPASFCVGQQQVFRVILSNLGKGKKDNKNIDIADLTFNWVVPAGLTVVSGQNTGTLTVMPTSGFTSGQVSVSVDMPGTNTEPTNQGNGVGRITGLCSNKANASLNVALGTNCVTSPPVCPTPTLDIVGPATVCPSSTQLVTYTANITNGSANMRYTWAIPNGWFISAGQGTNSIQVYVGNRAGRVTLTVTDNCNNNTIAYQPVSLGTNCGGTNPPTCLTPQVTIMGPETVCPGQAEPVVYIASVANGSNDMQYQWNIPAGWFLKSGAGTNVIEVFVGNQPGQVGLTVTNDCNNTGTDVHEVALGTNCGTTPPVCTAPQFTIVGPDSVCAIQDEPVIYTANVTNGATDVDFDWVVPEDWFIVSGQGTNTIEVLVGFESGMVAVAASNSCGTASRASSVYTTEDCDGLTPLPVELLSFKGESTKSGVLLQWSTASEQNNDRFEIERGADGHTFTKIGEVKGNGNSSSRRNYSLRDPKAGPGTHYYRLKQVDTNGEFEYSNVIAVKHSHGVTLTNLVLMPNPVEAGQFTLSLPQIATDAQVQILDMNGRLVHSRKLDAGSYEASFSTQSLNLRSGLYLIKLKDGNHVSQGKLIVR